MPNIVEFLDEARPDSILDVGSLTGYMARTIGGALSYAPNWILLDRDAAAIEYARAKTPVGMKATFVNSELETWRPEAHFDAVLLTFTLLEVQDRKAAFEKIASCVSSAGHLLVALPDCLEDVIAEAKVENHLNLLDEFVRTDVHLPKIDKFTGQPYPFSATRLTRVISDAIEYGFALVALLRAEVADEGVFLMTFRRSAAHA